MAVIYCPIFSESRGKEKYEQENKNWKISFGVCQLSERMPFFFSGSVSLLSVHPPVNKPDTIAMSLKREVVGNTVQISRRYFSERRAAVCLFRMV